MGFSRQLKLWCRGLWKTLCMAGKSFDSACRHAIDHRQPYRWARFDGAAYGFTEGPAHPLGQCGEQAAEWSW
jgi:hypothetical protein